MADIWRGEIVLPNDNIIKDVGLASNNVASSPILPSAGLRFLSTVDTARIPLYLATGPSLDVWTTSTETEEWFQSILLSKVSTEQSLVGNDSTHEWWTCARSQSPIGILVQVDTSLEGVKAPRITEILFYGTIATPVHALLPTPPSSSPDLPYSDPERLPELRVHALPLSSELLHLPALPEFSPLPQPLSPATHGEPQFLPRHNQPSEAKSPKRQRDIFEEATIARKKARVKGGESVAAAAAKANDSQRPYAHRKSLSIDTKPSPFPDFRPPSAPPLSRPPSRQLSRSPSISSDIRPLSRKGLHDPHTKRSNLSQVATVPLHPEEPTIESRNKEALSKVVMAAMRMHGLQQRKRSKSRRGSVAPGESTEHPNEENPAEEAAKDEEYKLIYHQAFKGAVLALRKHMAIKPLHSQPDRLRDVVEKLLAIFCTDPLTLPLLSEAAPNPLVTPGSKQRLGIPGSTHSQGSPFDLPSGAKLKSVRSSREKHDHSGSPVSRKRPSEVAAELT